jgi:dihydrodipicolinate synthase/N-acetylneuraminate lyase
MVTPLLGPDELDRAGLEQLVEHIIAGGVSGLFVLGTTGEGPSLSYRLRRELIEQATRQVNRRVPLLVGITDTAFVESVNLARHAANAGADALVLAPPYYLPGGEPELQEYLSHLIPQLPLPLFLYNMPALTKVQYTPSILRWALQQPQIAGLKDSSGNMTYFREAVSIVKQRPDWCLLVGPEETLAETMQAGGDGGVPGGANVFPKLYVQTCLAARAKDSHRTEQLQAQILRVSQSLYRVGRHPSAIIKGIKCALSCLGVCSDFMAEPFHRFRSPERAIVLSRLPELVAEVEKLVSNHHSPDNHRAPTQSRSAIQA